MKSIILFSVLFITILLLNESKAKTLNKEPKAASVTVGLYYNPYDTTSISFITNQGQNGTGVFDLMLPNTSDLEVNFVPWSNANSVNAGVYSCPGETDCLPTRLQACAIEIHKNDQDGNNQIFHFIVCTTSNSLWSSDPTGAVVQCVNQLGEWLDEGEYLNECAKNKTESDAYLASMQQQSTTAGVTKVPWVTINGERNTNAETDLKTEVCNSFDGSPPEACTTSQQPGSSSQQPVSSSTYPPSFNPLPVNIFYTSYDDNSIEYIKNQGPNGNGVWELMLPNQTALEIDFVPWGNQNSASGNYTCPGEQNCLATRLHACAIAYHQLNITTNHQIFHFIYCTVGNEFWKTNPTKAVDQCINIVGEWPDQGESLLLCAENTEESNEYLEEMRTQFLANGVTYVPWVTFNGQHNTDAESDLKSAVCGQYGSNKPDACSTSQQPGSSSQQPVSSSTYPPSFNPLPVNIFYTSYDDKSIEYIKKQGPDGNGIWELMLPNKTTLEIDFVPWGNQNSASGDYTCPGEQNCLATRLHACAIAYHQLNIYTNHQIFHFIYCTVDNEFWKTNPTKAVDQCINIVGEWPDQGESLLLCAENTEESNEYLEEMRKQTLANGVTYVPWVTFNGQHNTDAESDLMSAVCGQYDDNNKPGGCPSGGPGSIVQSTSKLFIFTLIIITIFSYLGLQ